MRTDGKELGDEESWWRYLTPIRVRRHKDKVSNIERIEGKYYYEPIISL